MTAAILAGEALAQSNTATAQGPVVSVFLLDTDPQALVGSIVKSDSSKTTIALSCPEGESADECGFPSSVTIVAGPSTFRASITLDSVTADIGCKIHGSTVSAVCSETLTGPAGYFALGGTASRADLSTETGTGTSITTSSTSTTLHGSDISYYPVTITAGAGIASGTAEATSTSASGSATSTGSAASASGSNTANSLTVGMSGGVAGLVGLLMAVL